MSADCLQPKYCRRMVSTLSRLRNVDSDYAAILHYMTLRRLRLLCLIASGIRPRMDLHIMSLLHGRIVIRILGKCIGSADRKHACAVKRAKSRSISQPEVWIFLFLCT